MKIYLAGPMRGIPEFNFPAFDAAAERGRALGHTIISPAELDRNAGFSEKGHDGKVDANGHNSTVTLDFMRQAAHRDFAAIVGVNASTPGVDAVALLPGWEKSKGVAGELALAKWIGLQILDAQTFEPMAVVTNSYAVKDRLNAQTVVHLSDPIQNGEFVVKGSGEKTTFATGAVRDAADNKGFFHCLPFIAIERLARLFQAGAKKYGKDNWRKGIDLSRYIDAIFRHLFKLNEGWTDEDHAAAIMWNAGCFMWTAEQIRNGSLPASLNDIHFPVKP